jgi:PPM family protein phosphatase
MKSVSLRRSGLYTDAGPVRSSNEDRVHADDETGIYLVADGLGGHAAGDVAAQTAMDVVVRELSGTDSGAIDQRVRAAFTAANNEIFALAQSEPVYRGMACVLTVAVASDDSVTVGHVGDSRLYLVWNGNIRKVTPDHSPVGEQEDAGLISEAEAMAHPRRNEIFRDVGSKCREPEDDEFVEVRSFPFHADGALLLCSDGLTDALASHEIGEILETYSGDPGEVAERLVAAANESGGQDNVSVVFVAGPDFVGTRSPEMLQARGRHAITRVRRSRARWRRRLGRILWLVLGMILGVAMWVGWQRWN